MSDNALCQPTRGCRPGGIVDGTGAVIPRGSVVIRLKPSMPFMVQPRPRKTMAAAPASPMPHVGAGVPVMTMSVFNASGKQASERAGARWPGTATTSHCRPGRPPNGGQTILT